MQDGLHKFASVWCTTNDDVIVMCGMGEVSNTLGLYAYDAHKELHFKKEFSEAELEEAKGHNLSWGAFFPLLSNVFNDSLITAKSSDTLLVQFTGPSNKAVSLVAPRTEENMEQYIYEQMLLSHQMQSHPKDFEGRELSTKEEAKTLEEQNESLERELQALKENLARNKQQEDASRRRLEELKKENSDLAHKVDDPWQSVKDKQKEPCRLVNPLRNKTCKNFDPLLLRLIKSTYVNADSEDYDETSVIHRVVKPFTVVEMREARDKYLPDPLYGAVLKALDKIEDWDYSVFAVQCALNGDDHASLPFQEKGGALFVTFYALFWKYNLFQKFNLDEQIALNWVSAVEAGYHGNPYHNSMHAADVLHITHYIISKGGLIQRCQLSDEMILSALFSAAIHDFDHPGINNNFHIKTRSHLATLYNDRSVLENLHVSSIFELMKNPAFNILNTLTDEQRREVREVVVEMVLATDMGLHGKYVAMMKTRMQERADFLQKEDKLLALAMALKMADISNCGRPKEIYLRWSSKISDEFYQQGDRERNLGLACSPFMDRLQPAIAKGQISFMNYIVIPFFEQVAELLPNMRIAVDYAEGNKTYWSQNDDS